MPVTFFEILASRVQGGRSDAIHFPKVHGSQTYSLIKSSRGMTFGKCSQPR